MKPAKKQAKKWHLVLPEINDVATISSTPPGGILQHYTSRVTEINTEGSEHELTPKSLRIGRMLVEIGKDYVLSFSDAKHIKIEKIRYVSNAGIVYELKKEKDMFQI